MRGGLIELTLTDREYLEKLLAGGVAKARVFKRATGLLELSRGKSVSAVATTLNVARPTVAAWRDGYKESGLRCLEEAPRSGRPIEIDGRQRAKLTALACSQAPEGHARWTMRLLADKAVELGYCEHISHTEVATILKATKSSRISRKPGVWGR
jgi:putative transposase